MSTTDDECRSDAFVRSSVRPSVFVRFRSSAHSDRVPARAVRVRTRHRAIAPHRDLPSVVVTYVFKPHEPDLQLHVSPEPPQKPCTDTPEGNVASIDGPLRRVMTRPIDRSLDRDSTRRRDSTTRDSHGAARRVERRLRRGPTPGIGGEIARVTEQVRLERSTDRPVDRSRRRHSPRGIRMETTATDGLFAPRRARARRMDRMRRMSASGDGTMSARKQAPSSARRLSRPSAYGACDARWDDDLIRARWKRTNE